jgi:hypothetical protein
MIKVLMIPPEKLKMKVGDIKVPIIKELNRVRRIVTSMAHLQPIVTNVINVITLANPNFNPGIG